MIAPIVLKNETILCCVEKGNSNHQAQKSKSYFLRDQWALGTMEKEALRGLEGSGDTKRREGLRSQRELSRKGQKLRNLGENESQKAARKKHECGETRRF